MTSYSTVQKQQLSQLGAYLQEKRQEQGKSLEDISLQTYIRAQLLKAVENGDTTDLPQPIFVQGFIRRYADSLGLDGSNFAKQFPVHSIPNTPRPTPRPATQFEMTGRDTSKLPLQVPQASGPRGGALPVQKVEPSVVVPKDVAEETRSVIQPVSPINIRTDFKPEPRVSDERGLESIGSSGLNAAAETSQPSGGDALGTSLIEPVTPLGSDFGSTSSGSGKSWLPWGVGAVVLLVGAISFIAPRFLGNRSEPSSEPIQTEVPDPEVIQAETFPATPEPVPEPEPVVSSAAPVSVQVEVTEAGPSWMSVNVDGEIVFEGLLNPGTQETWEGQEVITMNVGNAGAALVSANGGDPTPAGNPGGAEVLRFTADEE
ncbi:MAG: helix-turn-helix domain-containing protein [Cyanobacteria bacterium P01_D01_bin.156]